jgi:hypothetical protein
VSAVIVVYIYFSFPIVETSMKYDAHDETAMPNATNTESFMVFSLPITIGIVLLPEALSPSPRSFKGDVTIP